MIEESRMLIRGLHQMLSNAIKSYQMLSKAIKCYQMRSSLFCLPAVDSMFVVQRKRIAGLSHNANNKKEN